VLRQFSWILHCGLQLGESLLQIGQEDPQILAFEAADATNPPAPGTMLFIGSSSIRLWKTLADDFSKQRVLNRGFGGSQIANGEPRPEIHVADRLHMNAQGYELWRGIVGPVLERWPKTEAKAAK